MTKKLYNNDERRSKRKISVYMCGEKGRGGGGGGEGDITLS